MSKKMLKLLGVLLSIVMIAAACGSTADTVTDVAEDAAETVEDAVDGDEEEEAMEDEEEAMEDEEEEAMEDEEEAMEDEEEEADDSGDAGATGGDDGVLNIGTIFPVTGDLAFLGPAEVAGAELAIQDINAAGGVFGADVVINQGDSGDTTTDTAAVEVDRLLAEGADAIIGAASSAVSFTVIDRITSAGVIQFSPANTSPDFTTFDDGGLYFRTAPSDLLQGRVLADQILAEGNATASVIFRQESYGTGLADAFRENFEGAGGIVDEFLPYAVDVESFDAEVDALVSAGSDAILVIGFDESANIVTAMNERGIGPTSEVNVWGVDGNVNLNALLEQPEILEGFRQTQPSVDLGSISDFIDRLVEEMGDEEAATAFGAETYDAVIITALAAVVADADGGAAIAAEINDVTREGTQCTSFALCIELIEAGEDIDYDGIGGPYEFVDAGEPAAASYLIDTYGADGADADLAEFVFAS